MPGTPDRSHRLSMGASTDTARLYAFPRQVKITARAVILAFYSRAISPGDSPQLASRALPSLSLPRHELETTLGYDCDSFRPVRLWPQFFSSLSPDGAGSLSCRLGMGAYYLNLLCRGTKKRLLVVSWALMCGSYSPAERELAGARSMSH